MTKNNKVSLKRLFEAALIVLFFFAFLEKAKNLGRYIYQDLSDFLFFFLLPSFVSISLVELFHYLYINGKKKALWTLISFFAILLLLFVAFTFLLSTMPTGGR